MVSGTSASLCWILLSVCFTVSCEGKIITAEPGDTVTLPCQAPRNTTVHVVEWIRRDLDNPTVCFYRGSKCERSDHSFKGRVQLNRDRVKNGDVSLILKNVMINDAGAYECYVRQRESKRRKRDVHLDHSDLIKPIVYLTVGNSGGEVGDEVRGQRELTIGLGCGLVGLFIVIVVVSLCVLKYKSSTEHNSYNHPLQSDQQQI